LVTLNENSLQKASHWLAAQDEGLALVLEKYGYPPLWSRVPGFSTAVHIILEQQVSLASANATFARLKEVLQPAVIPETFLELGDEALRAIGFSRQKIGYTRLLAQAILNGDFNFDTLTGLDDEAVRTNLKQLKGIGHWTADIYLSECLMRPDILPQGDIALYEAFRVLRQLPKRPDYAFFEAGTQHWRPWRSVGTRMLWHFYLNERKKINQTL